MTAHLVDRLNAALSGRYAILSDLGEGGMASVYLADDLRHERKVALKVLRPELAAVVGAERFLGEIKTTANLQHPHILPLFDSGEADGFLFFVMPFVEGETLRGLLDREKQLPVEEAVRIADAVASALAYAHSQGVIHRDIKPANILMSRSDPIVADFGIALAVSAAGGSRLTETGLSVGTPYYMSPEQATGDRTLMPASDVYALGCILYEMLVGDPPFTGSTAQAVLGKIISGDARRPTEARPSVPANVEGAIMRSLERVPADRFHDAEAFRRALKDPSFRHGQATAAGGAGASAGRSALRRFAPWAVAVVAVLYALASGLGGGPAPGGVEYLGIPLPDSAEVALRPLAPLNVARHALAVPPGGGFLVYMGYDGETTRLYRRDFDAFDPEPIPGTEGASDPFFSPDGAWIGFFAGTQIKKVSVRGGAPEILAEAPNAYGGYWAEDGEIFYPDGEGTRIMGVPAAGGTPVRVTPPELRGGWMFAHPQPLPGGEALLTDGSFPLKVLTVSLESGEPKVITTGKSPRYVAPGYLVFARGSTLFAARFDADAQEILGDPVPVVEGVRSAHSVAQYTIGDDGTLYFVPGRDADVGPLVWADFQGGVDTLDFGRAEYQRTSVSPDGTRLAALVVEGSVGVWVLDLASGRRERIREAANLAGPIWSPDGMDLVYGIPPDGESDPRILVLRPGGAAGERVLAVHEGAAFPDSWSRDGRYVLYDVWLGDRGGDLFYMDMEAEDSVEWLSTEASEWGAEFSPDMEWVAYISDESGQYQVYIEPFVRDGRRYQISSHDHSEEPLWSADGSTIYYRAGNQWWAVDVTLEPRFTAGAPRLVLEGAYFNVAGRSFDLHPDGDRFLVIDTPRERTADRIYVIKNWVEEMKRQVGG